MAFDPVVSLKVVNNQRLMLATHRGEYRDLGGALAITSDAPPWRWNCLEGFTTDERRVESVLDVGFSLLRAFDRPSAVRLTPLDRPKKLEERLARRGLVEREREVSMVLDGDLRPLRENEAVRVVRSDPETASAWASTHAQARSMPAHLKAFILGATLANVLDGNHAFYVAEVDGAPVGTALCVNDAGTAGIYSMATIKSQRRTGVASALLRRAVADAQASGATCVCLETPTDNADALRLYERAGFVPAHESVLWGEREA